MAVSLRSRDVLQILATAALLAVAALGAVRTTTAGIQGSGVRLFAVIGPISAVGSGGVTVGGVDYSTSGAQVDIDGHPGKQGQLQPGDVVSIRGTSNHSRGHMAAASSLSFSGNVRGEVTGVDIPAARFFVLGQTVRVNADTQFDPSIQPSGLQGLQNGAAVEVSGFADAEGDIVASRVSSVGNSRVARVVGTVQNLDPQQKTFNVQSLSVNYANAVVKATLSEGASVTVQGPQPAGNAALGASRVDAAMALQAQPGSQGRIEGLITDFASGNYFEIDGQAVSVDSLTHLNLHVPLGLNVYVRVSGTFDDNGTLVASQVQSKASHD